MRFHSEVLFYVARQLVQRDKNCSDERRSLIDWSVFRYLTKVTNKDNRSALNGRLTNFTYYRSYY